MSDVSPPVLAARLTEALTLHGKGQFAAAATLYREILKSQPLHFDAMHLLGALHMQQGDMATAAKLIKEAVSINPDYAPAFSNLAVALHALGQRADALAAFDRALALQPNAAETEFNRSLLLTDLGRHREALEGFARTTAADPRHAGAHVGRGRALERLGRWPEALDAYNAACALQPRSLVALHNLACALHSTGRVEDARALHRHTLQIDPNFPEGHLLLAESHLLTCDFATGWAEYEWRWRVDGMMAAQRRDFAQPQWRGEDIAGRTILLWGEQGFGDMIQFCRFAAVVAARGARVLLEVPTEIAGLVDPLPGVAQVLRRGDSLPPFDVHCPLMSLPLVLGADAAPDCMPVPYLTVDRGRRDAWRARLATEPSRLVGLVWSGRKTHRNDHQRSLALSQLVPLFDVPGVKFVAVPPEFSPEDQQCGFPILAPGPAAFVEAATMVDALDLVIAVDTAFAHVAGALGKEVWVLLQMTPDWRWQLERSDSPWYPSARLFRQKTPGDWSGVIAEVAEALRKL